YPWPLKQRILGSKGHLSNNAAAEFALELAKDGTKIIFLGHLSQQNNTPALALAATGEHLSAHGFSLLREPELVSGPFVHVSVATQDKHSEVAIL
ncbi:MAG: MBL fold metallo-hydrolase, partial [Clostridia bacterium]|nr:MBL fold metallo-hydrolase [Clostridia bacterium]